MQFCVSLCLCEDVCVCLCLCACVCVCSGNKRWEFVIVVVACGCPSLPLHNRPESKLHFLLRCSTVCSVRSVHDTVWTTSGVYKDLILCDVRKWCEPIPIRRTQSCVTDRVEFWDFEEFDLNDILNMFLPFCLALIPQLWKRHSPCRYW